MAYKYVLVLNLMTIELKEIVFDEALLYDVGECICENVAIKIVLSLMRVYIIQYYDLLLLLQGTHIMIYFYYDCLTKIKYFNRFLLCKSKTVKVFLTDKKK